MLQTDLLELPNYSNVRIGCLEVKEFKTDGQSLRASLFLKKCRPHRKEL